MPRTIPTSTTSTATTPNPSTTNTTKKKKKTIKTASTTTTTNTRKNTATITATTMGNVSSELSEDDSRFRSSSGAMESLRIEDLAPTHAAKAYRKSNNNNNNNNTAVAAAATRRDSYSHQRMEAMISTTTMNNNGSIDEEDDDEEDDYIQHQQRRRQTQQQQQQQQQRRQSPPQQQAGIIDDTADENYRIEEYRRMHQAMQHTKTNTATTTTRVPVPVPVVAGMENMRMTNLNVDNYYDDIDDDESEIEVDLEEEPSPPQWVDQLQQSHASSDEGDAPYGSGFLFLGDELKMPGRETKKPKPPPPPSPPKQQTPIKQQQQQQQHQTPFPPPEKKQQPQQSLHKWIEHNKGSGDTQTTEEPTTVAASSSPATSTTTSSEYQAFLEDAEQNCDLLFLKHHAAQEQQQPQPQQPQHTPTSTKSSSSNKKKKKKSKKKEKDEYRCFAIVLHATYGMLLLHSTTTTKNNKNNKNSKNNKGPHYQIPGGSVERFDFQKYGPEASGGLTSWAEQRYLAARAACARHLKDQTGLSFPPARLWPMMLRSNNNTNSSMTEGEGDHHPAADEGPNDNDDDTKTFLMNEYKQRLFYVLSVSDVDFYQLSTFSAARNCHECPLRLKLSEHHSGFRMETDASRALAFLKHFSGGRVTKTLWGALKLHRQRQQEQDQQQQLLHPHHHHHHQDDNQDSLSSHDDMPPENPTTTTTTVTTTTTAGGGNGDDDGVDPNTVNTGYDVLFEDSRQNVDWFFLQEYSGPFAPEHPFEKSAAASDEKRPAPPPPQPLEEPGKIYYGGYVFVLHERYGMMLLRRTRKARQGPHFQTPGGRVDDVDFRQYRYGSWVAQCYLAARAACVRELHDHTGLSISPQRLRPVAFSKTTRENEDGEMLLMNEYEERLFYVLTVTDEDFNKQSKDWMNVTKAQNDDCPLLLKLSSDYTGFYFEENSLRAIELLEHHGGGKVFEALWMALQTRS